jgi:Reverse transcriptase (RNA-dependent DNA polymerase)
VRARADCRRKVLASRSALLADTARKRARLAKLATTAFTGNGAPRRAYALLRKFQSSDRAIQDITVLRHPDTDDEHSSPAGVMECLVAHHSKLAAQRQPRDAAEAARLGAVETRVREWRLHKTREATQDRPFVEEHVARALGRVSAYKAPGPDGVHAELLKYAGDGGVRMITRLFNAVLTTTLPPAAWRQGSITSIHKAGDRTDCGNYRGITLLPALDKVFMSLLVDRLQDAAPFHPRQYTFTKGRGTTEASFNIITFIRSQRMRKRPTYVFFLDIRKAFDTIVRSLLLLKLRAAGITGHLWHIIANLYDQTRSCCSLPFSQWNKASRRAAPRPLPFATKNTNKFMDDLFMDDLLTRLSAAAAEHGIQLTVDGETGSGQAFAGDSNAPSATAAGLQALKMVMWQHSIEWLWDANVIKSHIVVFNPEDPDAAPPCLHWGQDPIPLRTETKNLGLYLTSDCKWLRHMRYVKSNGYRALHAARPALLSGSFTFRDKCRFIKTFIVPAMRFGMEVGTGERRRTSGFLCTGAHPGGGTAHCAWPAQGAQTMGARAQAQARSAAS